MALEIQQAGYVARDARRPEMGPYYRLVCAFGILHNPAGVLVRCPCESYDAGELDKIVEKLAVVENSKSIPAILGIDEKCVEELSYNDRRLEWVPRKQKSDGEAEDGDEA